jgi:hypothetical protein
LWGVYLGIQLTKDLRMHPIFWKCSGCQGNDQGFLSWWFCFLFWNTRILVVFSYLSCWLTEWSCIAIIVIVNSPCIQTSIWWRGCYWPVV